MLLPTFFTSKSKTCFYYQWVTPVSVSNFRLGCEGHAKSVPDFWAKGKRETGARLSNLIAISGLFNNQYNFFIAVICNQQFAQCQLHFPIDDN